MHFAKPSWRRALWSVTIVFVISSVVTGIAVAIGFIAGKDPNASVPAGEYIRLLVASLAIWGPTYLLIAWQVSIPTIIGIGVLAATVRHRTRSANDSQGPKGPSAPSPR